MNSELSPKVSIVVPCYNVESYLSEALNSLSRQTLQDIEILCVNDGSTDRTKEIIESYQNRDGRFKLIDCENGGYGKAMNIGFSQARGEYVGIVESDDYVAPDMYEKLYCAAVENDLDMVRSDFTKFWTLEDGSTKTKYESLSAKDRQYGVVIDPSKSLDIFNAQMLNWTGLYRRSFIEEHGIRHHESPGASYQDNGFWFQTYCNAHRVMLLPEAFYFYRQDNAASSINQNNKVFCMLDEYQWIEEWLRSNPELEQKFIGVFHYKKTHNLNFAFSLLADQYQGIFLDRYSREYRAARDAGELDEELFWPDEWKQICEIMDDPDGFLVAYRQGKLDGASADENIGRNRNLVYSFARVVKNNGLGYAVRRAAGYLRRGGFKENR